LFHDEDSLAENDAVFRAVGDLHGQDVLDIGCGNGLACGYVDLDRYVGIDPAPAMLRQLHRHYPSAPTVCSTLKAFVTDTEAPPQYDVVLGLFGVGSYLSNLELSRIPTLVRPGGRAHVMFYAPGYVPVTHQRTNHYPPYRVWAPDRLEGMTQTIGHFILVTYRAEEPLGASR
jgi:SAM-dependent methyltransferase